MEQGVETSGHAVVLMYGVPGVWWIDGFEEQLERPHALVEFFTCLAISED